MLSDLVTFEAYGTFSNKKHQVCIDSFQRSFAFLHKRNAVSDCGVFGNICIATVLARFGLLGSYLQLHNFGRCGERIEHLCVVLA